MITIERNLLTQKVLFTGRRERIELIVISLEVIRAIIDSLVRVRVSVIGCIIITVMDEFVIVAERLLLIGGEIILFEVLVGLKVRLERFVSVNGIVGDKRNYLDFW